ncbi:MAG: ROK family protein [Taibaiella sp.]|nr:ROK family protein [Taibaiella sp.]
MAQKFSIGVDIGGTNVAYGIVDEQGNIGYEKWWATASLPSVRALAERIKKRCAKTIPGIRLKIAGVSGSVLLPLMPRPGASTIRPIFPGMEWSKSCLNLRLFFNIPVSLANDANATAFGEGKFGGASGLENYAVITIGTGIGSGIICNGKIIEGFDGNGGEFGHTVVAAGGRLCGCGRKGCLETYTSASGIRTTAMELAALQEYNSPLSVYIRSGNPFDSKLVFDYLLDGDLLAREVFRQTGECLGMAIANLVTLLGLERIFLFGGPVKAGEALLEPIRQAFKKNVIMYYRQNVRIEATQLPERNSAILGAASLVKS